ncbi:uncharacterized [Tachysurus ichikawai]
MALILARLADHHKFFKVLRNAEAIRKLLNTQPLYNRKALSPARTMGTSKRGLSEYSRGWGVRNVEYRALAGHSFPGCDTTKKEASLFFPLQLCDWAASDLRPVTCHG